MRKQVVFLEFYENGITIVKQLIPTMKEKAVMGVDELRTEVTSAFYEANNMDDATEKAELP